MDVLDDLDI